MSLNEVQYVQFVVGGENYAIEISDIREVIKMEPFRSIPNAPAYVKGIMELRDHIIPVISLRQLFQLADDEFTKKTRIIIVQIEDQTVGLIADEVNKLVTFDRIRPAPEQIKGVHGWNFSGIGMSGDMIVGILKLEHVLIKDIEKLGAM